MTVSIDICLATFNGTSFIHEFYSSLLRQSYSSWKLIIRDDGSTDETVKIIDDIALTDPRVEIIRDDFGNLGVINNFSRLLEYSKSQYIMLADQDDVWDEQKIEKSLSKLLRLEQASNPSTPCLVFTDLSVVDAALDVIHPSFFRQQNLTAAIPPSLPGLLIQNVAPGCTMIFNRALLQVATPIPDAAVMHDWWLILCAVLHGKVDVLDEATIAYRQHGNNQVGAGSFKLSGIRNRIKLAEAQAQALQERFRSDLGKENTQILAALSSLSSKPVIFRQIVAAKNGFRKVGWLRNTGFYILM